MYIDLPTKCSKVTFHLIDTSKILLQIVMVSPTIMTPSPEPMSPS